MTLTPRKTHRRVLRDAEQIEKPWRDRFILIWLYGSGWSANKIADEFGTTAGRVSASLRYYCIVTREDGGPGTQYDDVLTEDYLKQEYVENKRSIADIGDEVGCSDYTVLKYLRQHDIPTRDPWCNDKTRKYSDVLTEDYLIQEYVVKGRPALDIAEEVGCSVGTVIRYLENHDIAVRGLKEALALTHSREAES